MSFSTSIFCSKVPSKCRNVSENFAAEHPHAPPPTPRKKKWNLSLQKCDVIFDWHTKIPRSAPGSRLWRRNRCLSAGWKASETRCVLWFPSTVEDSSLKLLCGGTKFLKMLCRTTMYLKSRVYLTRFELDICCTSSNDCCVSNYLDIKYMLSHGQVKKKRN